MNKRTEFKFCRYEWRRYGVVQKSCMIFSRIFKLPWVIFLYLFLPYSNSGNYYALPVNRMLNYLASYSIYLLVLTIENNWEKTTRNMDSFSWYLKCIIILYAMSFIVRMAKLMIIEGPLRYFRYPAKIAKPNIILSINIKLTFSLMTLFIVFQLVNLCRLLVT